jgi:hypothetical protein
MVAPVLDQFIPSSWEGIYIDRVVTQYARLYTTTGRTPAHQSMTGIACLYALITTQTCVRVSGIPLAYLYLPVTHPCVCGVQLRV